MKVSIIIVSYYTGSILAKNLQIALQQSDLLKEVIVVNNGNPKIMTDFLKSAEIKFEKLKVINNSFNQGFSASVNKAVKKSTGEYILLLNPDCILDNPNVLDNCMAQLKRLKADVAGTNLIDDDGNEHPTARRNLLLSLIHI